MWNQIKQQNIKKYTNIRKKCFLITIQLTGKTSVKFRLMLIPFFNCYIGANQK